MIKGFNNTFLFKLFFSLLAFLFVFSIMPSFSDAADVDRRKFEQLQREREMQQKKIEQMQSERADLIKEIRRVESLNRKYSMEMDSLKDDVNKKDKILAERLNKLEQAKEREVYREEKKVQGSKSDVPEISPVDIEDETFDILLKGGEMDPDDKKFREELARAHYNMGNIFFQKGEYHRAVVEYYQSVDLMPYDAETHYNLAFVSGEYLGDQATALKHYQWYMYLNPKADDAKFVKEKIAEAKIHLRSQIDSHIESEEGHYNLAR